MPLAAAGKEAMIHVAIVGTGGISHSHIKGLLTFPERCRIVALCDIVPGKAQQVKEQYHLDCAVFEDHKEMLEAGLPIDLVHVCTPPFAHAEVSIHAMEAGCNVLCEKPMAASLAECDAMLQAEKEHGVVLGQVAQNRFTNPYWKLKKVLDSGLAGKICSVQINSDWWRGHCYYDLWWRGTWEKECGGPTLNHAVHHIDLLNWLEGGLPEKTASMLTNVMHDNSEVEDLSEAIMKYANGSLASVTSSVVHHGEEQSIIVQCANAKLSAPWNPKAEVSMGNGFPADGGNKALLEELENAYQAIPDLKYTGHTGEIDDLLSALEKGTRPLITGADGKRTVEMITAIYKAGFTDQVVKLPIQPEDEYYRGDGIQKNAIHFYKKGKVLDSLSAEEIKVEAVQ